MATYPTPTIVPIINSTDYPAEAESYVTTNTQQTISASKTFSAALVASNGLTVTNGLTTDSLTTTSTLSLSNGLSVTSGISTDSLTVSGGTIATSNGYKLGPSSIVSSTSALSSSTAVGVYTVNTVISASSFLMNSGIVMWKAFITTLLIEGVMSQKQLNALSKEDQQTFTKIAKRTGLAESLGLDTEEEDEKKAQDMKRFEILRGEVIAGNDNPKLIAELKRLLL